MGDISNTQFFKAVQEEKKLDASQGLEQVYVALTEKGYNPINQIVGYIMSGDPTYITSRISIRKEWRNQVCCQGQYFLEIKT